MTTIALRLAVIALLLYAGVALWYGRVEERLQGDSPVVKSEPAAPPHQEIQEPSAPAEEGYQVILTRNIFQALRHPGDRTQTDLDDLAETSLRLVLLGTITGDRDDARAIIRDEKTQLEDIYQTGSEVQGAVISRISRGKVALLVNGREEVLTIKDRDGEDSGRNVQARGVGRAAQRQLESAEAVEHKVPQAMPRRRISFRNAEMPVTPDVSVQQPSEEGPPETNNQQPLPDDGPPPPEGGQEQPAEQEGQ